MDKTTGSGNNSSEQIEIWPLESCRFAYTLNNAQPVRCTWISDQPLFYSDCAEAASEDAEMYDDPVLMELERDIALLREKTNAYDKVVHEFAEPENKVMDLFRLDADFIGSACAHRGDDLESILATLGESRLAAQYISFAKLHGVNIQESRQVADASYDRENQLILVRADLERESKALLLVRELRRMWQHRHGAGMHPLTLHPDYAVVINRAQNADLLVSMIRTAWELQLSGHKEFWVRIENSTLADIGRSFAREAIADFRSINNGMAARAAFESWFLSERCRKSDRVLIQQMLADYQGYVFSDNTETSRLIALDLMKALGKMPFGTNYIESAATQMLADPVYTDVRDRSNANFLWFIKFERSFTEAEAEAKASAPATSSGEVIAFPAARKDSAALGTTEEKLTSNGSAEIFIF
ncbi:MAG: DUF6782 family putative metallopeptidase [Pseudobdellovibrionaceae bacterium]